MNLYEKFYPEMGISGFSSVDGTVNFYQFVNSLIRPDMIMLDYGAGRGGSHIDDECLFRRNLIGFKGRVAKIIGADVDPVVESNPALDEAILIGPDGSIALPDNSVDLILSDWVFEHLPDPASAARELRRILKPGGWICARTPNRNGYVALGNRFIPDGLRGRILSRAQPDRKNDDIFPAYYRLNSRSALKVHFPLSRFRHCIYGWNSEPSYVFQNLFVLYAFALVHGLTVRILPLHWHIFMQKRA